MSGAWMVLARTALWLVLFSFSAAFPAYAEPTKAAKKEAFRLYAESEKRYREGRFEDAAALLKKAYELDPAPTLLFNLARALESAGDLEGALESYQSYLAAEPKARDRKAIEKRLATLEQQVKERAELARIKEQELAEKNAPPPKEEKLPDPPGVQQQQQQQNVVTAPIVREPDRETSPLPFVVLGAGAAGLITGGVLGVLASGKRSSAEDEPDFMKAEALDDSARGLATGANVAYVAGGAILTAGAVWLILELSE